jgi:hypothetical protein
VAIRAGGLEGKSAEGEQHSNSNARLAETTVIPQNMKTAVWED